MARTAAVDPQLRRLGSVTASTASTAVEDVFGGGLQIEHNVRVDYSSRVYKRCQRVFFRLFAPLYVHMSSPWCPLLIPPAKAQKLRTMTDLDLTSGRFACFVLVFEKEKNVLILAV